VAVVADTASRTRRVAANVGEPQTHVPPVLLRQGWSLLYSLRFRHEGKQDAMVLRSTSIGVGTSAWAMQGSGMQEQALAAISSAPATVAPDLGAALALLAESAAHIRSVGRPSDMRSSGERLVALVTPILDLLCARLGCDIAWIVVGDGLSAPELQRCALGSAFPERDAATFAPIGAPLLSSLRRLARQATLPTVVWLIDPALGTSHGVLAESATALALRAAFAVPLLAQREETRLLGVVVVGARSPDILTPDVVQLVELVAGQLGTAIGHAAGTERLRVSEERARLVTEEATDTIYMVDTDGRFVYVNPQVERHLGFTVAEVLGRQFGDFIAPARAPGARESPPHDFSGEADDALYDLDLRRKDGAIRTFEINARNLHDPQCGEFVGRFGIARDITERRRLEHELARRNQALEALNAIATLTGHASDRALEAILDEALGRTLAVYDVARGSLHLLDREGGAFTLAAYRGYGDDYVAAITRLPTDVGIPARALATTSPVVGASLTAELTAVAPETVRAEKVGAFACVALRSQERVLGLLSVAWPDAHPVSAADSDTLAVIGAQLGAAIENARLAAEAAASRAGLEVKTAQLSRLLEVSAEFAANRPLDAVLDAVATAIVETLGFGSAHVRVRDERGGALVGVGFCGYEPGQAELLRTPTPLAFYNRLLDERFRLGGVQYIPHEIDRMAAFGDDWVVVRRTPRSEWRPGRWHPEDALIVPLRGRDGALLGVIFADEPLDGHVPDLEKAALLELFGRQASLAIENGELYAQSRRDLRRQDALREVIEHISAELDLDRLLEQILADAVDLLGGDAGAFGLIDRETGVSRIGTINNMPDDVLHAVIHAGQGLTGTILATGQPVVIDTPTGLAGAGEGSVIHSCVGVPVFQAEKLVGTFFVGSTDPAQHFGPRDIATLELFAKHAALALGNARLYEEARAQAARLETLREAIEQISSELDLPALLNRLAVSTVRLLNADYGVIALVDEERGEVRVEAGYNLPSGLLGKRLAPGEWLADLALARSGPLLITPAAPPPGLPHYHGPGHSHIATPIWWQDRLIGVFSLSSTRPEQRFDQADLDTLTLLGRHAAVAIENAGLYSALQERFSQVEGINAVGTALIEERDLDRVLETVAEQIIGLLGADGCSIFLLDPDEAARVPGEELVLAVVVGAGAERMQGRKLPLDGSFTGEAVRGGRPLLVDTLQDNPRDFSPLLLDEGIDQLLMMPLQTSERTVGSLNAYGKRGKVFGQRDIEVMTLFAHQAAAAIENARLHAQGRVLAVAEERNRMAREIHDTLAQGFTGIILQLQVAESLLEGEEEAVRERLTRAQDLARSSLREARRSVWNLRPSSLQGRTLAEGLRSYLAEWGSHTGIVSRLFIEGEERALAPETEETLLRVAQEALNNTYKHANARHAEVTLTIAPTSVRLAVCDDGIGIDGANEPDDGGGFGLVSMRERVSRLNGWLDIESAPDQGTRVLVSVADHGPPARREPGSVPG